jgi:hypothetical protein
MKGWHVFGFYSKSDVKGKKLGSRKKNKSYMSPKNLRSTKNLRNPKLRSLKNLSQERHHHLRWIGKLPRRRRKSSLLQQKQQADGSSPMRSGTRSAKKRMKSGAKKESERNGSKGR